MFRFSSKCNTVEHTYVHIAANAYKWYKFVQPHVYSTIRWLFLLYVCIYMYIHMWYTCLWNCEAAIR